MKRFMTLAATILAIVAGGVYSAVNLIGVKSIFDLMKNGVVGMMAIFIGLYVAISALFTITAFYASHDLYKKKFRKIFIAILCDLVFAGLLVYVMISAHFDVVSLLVLLGAVASAALYITDMFLEKKRASANGAPKQPEAKAEEPATEPAEAAKPAEEERPAEEQADQPADQNNTDNQ